MFATDDSISNATYLGLKSFESWAELLLSHLNIAVIVHAVGSNMCERAFLMGADVSVFTSALYILNVCSYVCKY